MHVDEVLEAIAAERRRYLSLAGTFWGGYGDADVEIYRKAFVKTKTAHQCANYRREDQPHDIPAGSPAVRESGKVDGQMRSCYTCLPCLDAWAREIGELTW